VFKLGRGSPRQGGPPLASPSWFFALLIRNVWTLAIESQESEDACVELLRLIEVGKVPRPRDPSPFAVGVASSEPTPSTSWSS